MINGKQITFTYDGGKGPALSGVDIAVQRGEFVAVLGCNGCGKSTLIRHFNALLPLQAGSLRVADIDVSDEAQTWRLRRCVGMVFQNPDSQFVSSVVGEDVAFGLENYQVPREQIEGRVTAALHTVGLDGFADRAPHTLSGGQKQRAALAGVLALEPELLIFDEVTAMLDPEGRREVLDLIDKLHAAGHTVVMITHYVEEAIRADRVLLMKDGAIVSSGTPRQVLTDRDKMESAGIMMPLSARLFCDLGLTGSIPLTERELVEVLCPLH